MAASKPGDFLEASAARYPNRVAVVESDSRTLTYAELDKQSDALAGFPSTVCGVEIGWVSRFRKVSPPSFISSGS